MAQNLYNDAQPAANPAPSAGACKICAAQRSPLPSHGLILQDAPRRGIEMKIVCPSCEATYQVPEAVVAARRAMRCTRCGNNWVPADGDAVADSQSPAPPPGPAPASAATAAPAPADAPEPADLPFAVLVSSDEPDLPDTPAPTAPERPKPVPLEPATPLKLQPELPRPKPVAPLRAEQLGRDGKPLSPAPPAPRAPMAAWLASILLLLCLGTAALVFRTPVMKAWPPSTRLYAALGLYHR
jgi:predicted Zn finger-like uncharacterized protein